MGGGQEKIDSAATNRFLEVTKSPVRSSGDAIAGSLYYQTANSLISLLLVFLLCLLSLLNQLALLLSKLIADESGKGINRCIDLLLINSYHALYHHRLPVSWFSCSFDSIELESYKFLSSKHPSSTLGS